MSVSFLDPEKLYLSIVGAQVEGFSEGTFVNIVRRDETFQGRGSLKGTHLITKAKHSAYTLTFRLENTAPANTWIHSLYKLQETYGIVIPLPIVFRDLNGHSSFYCPAAVIQEPANAHGNKAETVEWTVYCAKGINTYGGSGETPAITQIIQTLNSLVQISGMVGIDLSDLESQAQELLSKGFGFVGGLFR